MSNEIYEPHLSAEQRCQAVAAILARGVLRYHRRIKYMNSGHAKNPSASSPGGLEVLDETRLTVSDVPGCYEDAEDTAAKALVKRPVAAYVERVYYDGDFSALGIGA